MSVTLPLRITVGKKSLKDGLVEFKLRAGGEMQKIPPDDAVKQVMSETTRTLRT